MTVQSRRLGLAGAMFAAGVAYLIWTALAATTVYYVTVSELIERGTAAYEQPVRVSGQVVDGTLAHDARAGLVRFTMTDGSGTLPVTYRGVKPDLLGYSVEGAYQDVVVEGRLQHGGELRASQLIVKHGPEFAAAPNGRAGVSAEGAP